MQETSSDGIGEDDLFRSSPPNEINDVDKILDGFPVGVPIPEDEKEGVIEQPKDGSVQPVNEFEEDSNSVIDGTEKTGREKAAPALGSDGYRTDDKKDQKIDDRKDEPNSVVEGSGDQDVAQKTSKKKAPTLGYFTDDKKEQKNDDRQHRQVEPSSMVKYSRDEEKKNANQLQDNTTTTTVSVGTSEEEEEASVVQDLVHHDFAADVEPLPQLQRGGAMPRPSQPGAYPAGRNQDPNEWLREDDNLDGASEDIEIGNGGAPPANTNLPDGLAVANPVTEQLSGYGEAEHVDPVLEQKKREEQKRRSLMLFVGMIVTAVALLAGLVLAMVFLLGPAEDSSNPSTDKEGGGSEVELPEEGMNATLVPTLSVEDLFFSQLPTYTVEAIQADESSPQARAFNWLIDDPGFASFPDWRKVQRFALATFFFATGGHLKNNENSEGGWQTDTNWLSYNHSECDWFSSDNLGPSDPNSEPEIYGLVASYPPIAYGSGLCGTSNTSHGKVERLVQSINGLQGTIPPEVFLLTSMRAFATVANAIGGTIPTEIGQLSKLELFAAVVGGLQGSIPSEIAKARNLTHFICFRNQVSGTIPTELGTLSNLKGLMLDVNRLDGTLPTELGLLSNAIWVSSYENAHNGTIPTQLGQLSSVRFLNICRNPYQPSAIPSQLGMLASIQELNIEGSHRTGTIPSELANMQAL